jgi:hypothetical protein
MDARRLAIQQVERSADGGEDPIDGRSVGRVVGGVGERKTPVRRDDEVTAHLAKVGVLQVDPRPTTAEVERDVGRQGAGCERSQPRRPAELERPVSLTGLIGEAREGLREATAEATNPAHRIEGDHENLGAPRTELVLPLAQLRQMISSMESPEPAQEDQHHPAISVLREPHGLAVSRQRREVGGGLSDAQCHA